MEKQFLNIILLLLKKGVVPWQYIYYICIQNMFYWYKSYDNEIYIGIINLLLLYYELNYNDFALRNRNTKCFEWTF